MACAEFVVRLRVQNKFVPGKIDLEGWGKNFLSQGNEEKKAERLAKGLFRPFLICVEGRTDLLL
jgi:hypothetical protein